MCVSLPYTMYTHYQLSFTTMKQYIFALIALVSFSIGFSPQAALASAPTFTANETVANVVAGTNDQSITTTTSVANVVQVKASQTFTVASLPDHASSIVVADCVVRFYTSTDDADVYSCNDGTADIARTTATGGPGTLRSAAQIAAALRLVTPVHDTMKHGDLALSGSGTTVVFTTSGTEISNSVIDIANNTSGALTTGAAVTGAIAVAQTNPIEILGTVDTGDVFTVTLPTVGAVSYTVLSSDTTTSNIATALDAAILASSGYSSQAFTTTPSGRFIVLSAKVPGTGFTQTSSATNRAAVAQRVTFTPADMTSDYSLQLIVNDTKYNAGFLSVSDQVANLVSQLALDTSLSCTENGTVITCTATSAGTGFTYSASVIERGGHSGGGGGSGKRTVDISSLQAMLDSLRAQLAVLMGKAGGSGQTAFSRNLTIGSVGADVTALQAYLNANGFVVASTGVGSMGHETTTFGPATRAALIKFQIAKGLSPAAGYFGPLTRAFVSK